jgi:[protein-PII] uridylyltransferase
MESGVSPGPAVARALSALQDTTIQVLYDFAVRHFYPAPNPTKSERLAIVATGGYGRGLLAPASDIDLLFIRPFKETPWDESVIEFILHTPWDGPVGHADRSVSECVRLAGHHHPDLAFGSAFLGRPGAHDELKKIGAISPRQRPISSGYCRTRRQLRQGEPLISSNQHQGGQGRLRDLQTLYCLSRCELDPVHHGVSPRIQDPEQTFL